MSGTMGERFRRKAISVAQARLLLEPHAVPLSSEKVVLWQAPGRRLARTIYAPHAMPHFARSGMDGFAVYSEDTVEADSVAVQLTVVETIPCGTVPNRRLGRGEAARIMTGAMLPEGADAVIMLEAVDEDQVDRKSYITVKRYAPRGMNVSWPGTEVSEGQELIKAGVRISTGETALLAAFGYERVEVIRKPKVAVFATGSELLHVGDSLQPGKVRNSNLHMLVAQIETAGGEPIVYGNIADQAQEAKSRLETALREADVVLTSGGVSVGDFDIMAELIGDSEGKLFDKIMMRPGSPTSAALWENKLLIALSGNPGACFVGFELLVRPVLMGMQGAVASPVPALEAVMHQDFDKVNAFERYVRAKVWLEGGKVYTAPLEQDKSSMMISIKEAEGLIIVPPGTQLEAGELVRVIPLKGWGTGDAAF
jgi:molybdopterin molybdotransferase